MTGGRLRDVYPADPGKTRPTMSYIRLTQSWQASCARRPMAAILDEAGHSRQICSLRPLGCQLGRSVTNAPCGEPSPSRPPPPTLRGEARPTSSATEHTSLMASWCMKPRAQPRELLPLSCRVRACGRNQESKNVQANTYPRHGAATKTLPQTPVMRTGGHAHAIPVCVTYKHMRDSRGS